MPPPESVWVPVALLLYVVYWECWENRHLYSWEVITGNDAEELEDWDEEEKLGMLKMFIITSVVALAPLVYVVLAVLVGYLPGRAV